MAQNLFAIIQWTNDGDKFSIHHLRHIIRPVKPFNDYKVGDEGVALYAGVQGEWEFRIHAVGTTRTSLVPKLKELLLQRNQEDGNLNEEEEPEEDEGLADVSIPNSKLTKRGPTGRKSLEVAATKPTSSEQTGQKPKKSDEAELEKAKEKANGVADKELLRIAAQQRKSSVIDRLNASLQEAVELPVSDSEGSDSDSDSDSSISLLTPLQPLQMHHSSPIQQPQSVPLNMKGYPTVAQKEPRRQKNAASMECENCSALQRRITELERRLKSKTQEGELERRLKSRTQEGNRVACVRLKAGVYTEEEASDNKMAQLYPGYNVYLHQNELHRAQNSTKRIATGQLDGRPVGRYLMSVFFTRDEIVDGSLGSLDQTIIDAIVAFSTSVSGSKTAEIKRVLRSKITSFRCKLKRKNNSVTI